VIAAGIGVTLYAGKGPRAALTLSRDLLAELRPAFVVLHTWPDAGDEPLVRELRELVPGVRVWISPGANSLAALSPAECEATGRRWAAWCAAHGVETLMPNIERPSKPGMAGWVSDDAEVRRELAPRLEALYAGCSSHASVALAVTSHDWPGTHPLPGVAYTHPAVALTLPQVYPAVSTGKASLVGRTTAKGRLDATLKRWARHTQVSPALRPGQPGWGIYGQLWGHSAAAVAWLADQADVYSGWALPLVPDGRAQAEGVCGLRLAIECRRRYGEGRGAIVRAQTALGLVPDGLPGPVTAKALGLEWLP